MTKRSCLRLRSRFSGTRTSVTGSGPTWVYPVQNQNYVIVCFRGNCNPNAGNGYSVATAALPANAGTTTGSGTYAAGSSQTVIATANGGYDFASWTEGGTVVSASSSYTFTLNGDRSLVANFSSIAPVFIKGSYN